MHGTLYRELVECHTVIILDAHSIPDDTVRIYVYLLYIHILLLQVVGMSYLCNMTGSFD